LGIILLLAQQSVTTFHDKWLPQPAMASVRPFAGYENWDVGDGSFATDGIGLARKGSGRPPTVGPSDGVGNPCNPANVDNWERA
jgi:hypothetical protein